MSKESKIIFILVGISSILILVLGTIFVTKPNSVVLEQNANANIEILDPQVYDWGEININGGNVEKTFRIKNVGKSALEVTNFKTSCMCTEVKVVIGGKDSPSFGMHTKSGWKGVIEPNQVADIRVVFDPLFHGPQALGPITRLVSFNTNVSNRSTVELKLTGNVVEK